LLVLALHTLAPLLQHRAEDAERKKYLHFCTASTASTSFPPHLLSCVSPLQAFAVKPMSQADIVRHTNLTNRTAFGLVQACLEAEVPASWSPTSFCITGLERRRSMPTCRSYSSRRWSATRIWWSSA